jgi:hypothetical protein
MKSQDVLNQLLDSTSKILAILTPMAEKFAKRESREFDPSGPRRRDFDLGGPPGRRFGNMSRKRNGLGMRRGMKPGAPPPAALVTPQASVAPEPAVASEPDLVPEPAVAPEPAVDVSDDTVVANTPVVDDAADTKNVSDDAVVAAPPVVDDSADNSASTLPNSSQEGGSRKKNRKSKGKKSRRSRR